MQLPKEREMLLIYCYILICIAFHCGDVNGLDAEHQAAYERVIECFSKGVHANEPGHNLTYDTVICGVFKAMDLCLVKPFNPGDSHSSEILDFFRALQLQRVILARESQLCTEPLPYQELKELVYQSGIMERENLTSIENDTYSPCAGEVSRKCYAVADKRWEQHSNMINVLLANINCYDKESKTCDSDMARHINTFLQAFKTHLQEKNGLLGGMIENIVY